MKLLLRAWRIEDASALQGCADDWEIARQLRDVFPHPYTLADAQSYLSFCLSRPAERMIACAIEADGALAGSIALTRGMDVYRGSAELGYWLDRSQWKKGIMSEAVRQMCRKGFAQWDIIRVYAEPFARNVSSRAVLEKNGFVLEGHLRKSVLKEGQFLDSCIYGLLREQ